MEDNIIKYKLSLSQKVAIELSGLLQNNASREVVIFCVGNPKIWYDCFAPFLAEILRLQGNIKSYIYGGINFAITSDNLQLYMDFIKAKHPSACIIVVDNCLTINKAESGTIAITKRATNVAGLSGDYLFGDISILLKTNPQDSCFAFLKNLQQILPQVANGINQALGKSAIINLMYNGQTASANAKSFVYKKQS